MGEDLKDVAQHYQVNVVLWEGRHLALSNANSKVVISIGSKKKTIHAKNNNTDSPYYNDFCIFSYQLPLSVLLDKILTIKVYQKSFTSKLIGSFSVELATVWSEPNHQFYHKWAVIADPKSPTSGVKGFIKCDIAVLGKGVTFKPTDEGSGNLEDNLLVPEGGTQERMRTRIILSVFRADSFSSVSSGKLKLTQPFIKITYGNHVRKTSVAKSQDAPVWNEELTFPDFFPPLMQHIFIEICDSQIFSRKSLGNTALDIRALYADGVNGFMPTFGPNFLYLYEPLEDIQHHKSCCPSDNSFSYMGRLLLSLRTEVIDRFDKEKVPKKKLRDSPKEIPPLLEKVYFEYNKFILFAAIFDALLFDEKSPQRNIKIQITMGPKKSLEKLKIKGQGKGEKSEVASKKKPKSALKRKPEASSKKKPEHVSKKKTKETSKKKKVISDKKPKTATKKKRKSIQEKKPKRASDKGSETPSERKAKKVKEAKKKKQRPTSDESETPSEKKAKNRKERIKKKRKPTSEDESETPSKKKPKKKQKVTSEDESETPSEKKLKKKKRKKRDTTSGEKSDTASEKKARKAKQEKSNAPKKKKDKTTSGEESDTASEKKLKKTKKDRTKTPKKKKDKTTSGEESDTASEKKARKAKQEKSNAPKKKKDKTTSGEESETVSGKEQKTGSKKKSKALSKQKPKSDSKKKLKATKKKTGKTSKKKKLKTGKKKKSKATSEEESETASEKSKKKPKPAKESETPSEKKSKSKSKKKKETKPKKPKQEPSKKKKREAPSEESSEAVSGKESEPISEAESAAISERKPEETWKTVKGVPGKAPHVQLRVKTSCDSTPGQTTIMEEDYSYITFSGNFPCICTFGEWPDSLKRIYCTNVIKKAIKNCTEEINKIKYDLQYQTEKRSEFSEKVKNTLANLSKSCESILLLTEVLKLDQTNLCKERKKVYRREIADIAQKAKLASQQKALKAEDELLKISTYLAVLTKYAQDPENTFPDTEIWLLQNNKAIAQYRMRTEDVAFSEDSDYRGTRSGKTQTILFRGKNGKIKAKLEILIWFGLADKFEECLKMLPDGLNEKNPLCSSIPDFKIPSQLICNEQREFQCRMHLFQGKIFFGFDNTGLTDAFVRVIIQGRNKRTSVHKNTLSPLWDETLVFSLIVLYGPPNYIEENPPSVTVELFDQDKLNKTELVGRCFIKPIIKFKEESYEPPKFPPKLKWEFVRSDSRKVGQILLAAELLEISDSSKDLYSIDDSARLSVPENIRPHNIKYRLDVIFWGVRPVKEKKLFKNQVIVVLECGDTLLKSPILRNLPQTLNFPGEIQSIELDLPKEIEYAPSFGLKIFYITPMTQKETYVATCLVPNIKYLLLPPASPADDAEGKISRASKPEEERQKKKENSSYISKVKKLHWKKIIPPKSIQKKRHFSFLEIPGYCQNDSLFHRKCKPKFKFKYQPILKFKKDSKFKYKNEPKRKFKYESTVNYGYRSIFKFDYKSILNFDYLSVLNFDYQSIFKFKNKRKPKAENFYCEAKTLGEEDEMLSWWVKYCGSAEDLPHSDELTYIPYIKIYEEELEAQPEFKGFQDFLQIYDMVTGHEKKTKEGILMAKVKAVLKLQELSKSVESSKKEKGLLLTTFSNKPLKFLARVYIVCGKNLVGRDIYGKSDPYLFLQLGNQIVSDRKYHFPKQQNPTFGKCYEFKGMFPQDYLLRIKVLDYDAQTKNDLIGETIIDLENRFYSKFYATCGLATHYQRKGFNAWRDSFLPSEILRNLCKQLNLDEPIYGDNEVVIEGHTFATKIKCETNDKVEIQSLMVLKKWQEMPLYGFPLVPEHVETRSLYNPSLPGIEQGKLVLWVDIFPANFSLMPPKVDITPHPPVAMELRAIVWNVVDVVLDDKSFIFNSRLSDLYVKGWILSLEEEMQKTDIHYRSLNGEGNFNWRFIFHFNYIPVERRMTVKKKMNAFDLHPEERKVQCKLEIQVWDNDAFGDDFLGTLILELNSMPRGAKLPSRCTLKMLAPNAGKINLFKIKKTRGWWPFRRLKMKETIGNEFEVTGKIDLELEILTETDALYSPAGKGRQEPNALPKPNRPDISSSRILNPLKVFRYVVLNRAKKWIFTILLIILVFFFFLVALYAFPNYLVKKFLRA